MSNANPIPLASKTPAFVTWEEGDSVACAKAAEDAGKAYAAHPGVQYRDRDNRDGAFEPFKHGLGFVENVIRDREIIHACIQGYERFGIVKNVIDLMADFSCKGISIVHPRGRVEKFGQEWFAKFNGPERSERIMNMFYKAGNVVVKRNTVKLPDKTLDVLRASGADQRYKPPVKLPAGEIPMGYTVLDPRWVEVVGAEVAPFVGPQSLQYAVRIPPELYRRLKSPKGPGEKGLVGMIPLTILNGATSEGRLVPLPPEKVTTMFYKKDDSRVWAQPMLYPMLDDLALYHKMKQADRAALDGVISHVRLWRLGSLENRIFPTPAAINRLSEVLATNVGGGSMDLIWGPELDLVETNTQVWKFLGEAKYVPTLTAIFQGLGIPMTLSAGSKEGGFTNNAMGLRVLLDRLEYGRMLLTALWMRELELVRAAFGFREPFTIVYDNDSLSDEATMQKLLVDMADRDIVSLEFVQDRIGAIPAVEASRMRREAKARKEGRLPPKAGPFHMDSQQNATNERSFVQQGMLTPSQVGLNHPPPKPGEKTPMQINNEQKMAEMAQKAQNLATKKAKKGNGRPAGAKDSTVRKKKVVRPRTAASQMAAAMAWATDAQTKIEDVTRPAFLAARGKKNLRQVTDIEAAEFEGFKFGVLCQFPIGSEVSRATVKHILETKKVVIPADVAELYQATLAIYDEPPAAEKARQLRAAVYVLNESNSEEGESNGDGDCLL